MVDVHISVEGERGCGFRKPAKDGVGVYLVGPSTGAPCGRLPFRLHACPTCGQGIKPGRGWQWIEPSKLLLPPPASPVCLERVAGEPQRCESCPFGLAIPEGKHGLIWVGESHYKTGQDFVEESHRMGVSRKIKAVPVGFELGKTVVYLAHRHTDCGDKDGNGQPVLVPALFSVFRPTGIDLVIEDEKNVPEKAVKLAEKHGARIVRVVRAGESLSEPLVASMTTRLVLHPLEGAALSVGGGGGESNHIPPVGDDPPAGPSESFELEFAAPPRGWKRWKPGAEPAGLCSCGQQPCYVNESLGLLCCENCRPDLGDDPTPPVLVDGPHIGDESPEVSIDDWMS